MDDGDDNDGKSVEHSVIVYVHWDIFENCVVDIHLAHSSNLIYGLPK